MAKLGIEHLKHVVDFAVAGVQVGADALADGKIDLADLAYVYKLVPYIGPAFDNIGEVPAEIGDLDLPEAEELLAYVATKLTVASPKATAIINHSLKILGKAYELYLEAKALRDELSATAQPVSGAV